MCVYIYVSDTYHITSLECIESEIAPSIAVNKATAKANTCVCVYIYIYICYIYIYI